MARVLISAVRFASMLANRNLTVEDLDRELQTTVDLRALAHTDQLLESEDLMLLARRFKRPYSYLLVDQAEVLSKIRSDNRTFLNRSHPISSAVLDEIETVAAMLESVRELYPEIRYELPALEFSLGTPAWEAAEAIRGLLAVSEREQLNATDEFAGLRLWANALQSIGVLVSQRRLVDASVRAFSLELGGHAAVVADTQDSPPARSFSLLHEYVHVVLRSTGVCDLDDHLAVERYCNAVAAAVLMPASLVASQVPGGYRFGDDLQSDEDMVDFVSKRLGASKAALLIRLRDLGRLDQNSFDTLERLRSQRRSKARTPGGQFYPTAFNRVGRRYARAVLGSLADGGIDAKDAATMLEIGEHLVPRFTTEFQKGERQQ